MLEVYRELWAKRRIIEGESVTGSEPTAKAIADRFGYEYKGLAEFDDPHRSNAVIFGRSNPKYDSSGFDRMLDRLNSEGYGILDVRMPVYSTTFRAKIIVEKTYEGGGVAVLERYDYVRQPFVLVGDAEDNVFMGLFFDTKPEYVGIVDEISQEIGMEPRLSSSPENDIGEKVEVPPVFRDFINQLNI